MKHTIIAVFLVGLLMLAGCSGIFTGPENGTASRDGAAGNLTTLISYSLSPGRTAYPSHDGNTPLAYTLEFAWTGGGAATPTHDPVSVSPGSPASLRLEAGPWTVTAKALAGGVEKASGSASVTIPENGDAVVAITLSPVGGSPAAGTLGYTLYFPDRVTTKSLTLSDADGNPVGSPVSALVSGTEGLLSDLAAGSYLLTATLSDGARTAGRTEAVHIVAGLTTKVSYNFYEDLPSAPISVTSDTDLAKIGVDAAWPLSGRYVLANDITLNDWAPLGSMTTPFTGSFDGGGNTITITSFNATALAGNQYNGIFAAVKGIPENKVRVKNLKIASSVEITVASKNFGLVSGYAENAILSGINLFGSLSITGSYVGGAVGEMRRGAELRDCVSEMDLTGSASATGGFVGYFLTSADGSEYGEGIDVLIKDCANSGDVAVSAGIAGGIAGGSSSGASSYLGRIEDCVYTGTITGNSSVGGIAGAIGGNGGDAANQANTSRILRCRTDGSINGGTAGGIVGSATYSALIAQCSSDTAITGPNGGGIAGVLNGARISDCWSDGSVEGKGYVGGIAAFQNDTNATGMIERCYSRAAVISTELNSLSGEGVGGICAMRSLNAERIVTRCVALNSSISSPAVSGMYARMIRRIIGGTIVSSGNSSFPGTTMNYAPDFPVTGPTAWVYLAPVDGTILEKDPPGRWLYEGTLGWDFDEVWTMGSDDYYPKLQGVD